MIERLKGRRLYSFTKIIAWKSMPIIYARAKPAEVQIIQIQKENKGMEMQTTKIFKR